MTTMKDAFDLTTVEILRSPDVAAWPITLAITAIDMDPIGGLTLNFDRPVPDEWKWPSNPDKPGDNIQFTVWAVTVPRFAAGFIPMWQGRPMGDRSLPPILSGFQDWWGDPRQLWPSIADYVPRAGDEIGFFVTAGMARLTDHVTSVAERSNVVALQLPVGDNGRFFFAERPSPPPPPVPPNRDAQFERLLDVVQAGVIALQDNTRVVRALNEQLAAVRARLFGVRP